ncbi:MAG TPA: hypothetical protein VM053_08405 [Gemmatimonadaceae bacterium]|nr:hypothetical protein [Gemmatimonadaceae bacterium]
MIGQLPPYALATPTFRLKALASHAGRASLGGDREVALVCFVSARLVAGMLPPLSIAPADSAIRAAAARQWLSSLMIPVSTRAAGVATVDAVGENDFRAAGKALRLVIDAGGSHLDAPSTAELTELYNEICAVAESPE